MLLGECGGRTGTPRRPDAPPDIVDKPIDVVAASCYGPAKPVC